MEIQTKSNGKRTWNVLITASYLKPDIERFSGWFKKHGINIIVPSVRERLTEEELLALVGDIDGVVCGDDYFTARVINAAPRLKVISKWGTGIDSIDVKAAEARGIRVCRTPDAFTEPVADTVMGYILCFARNIVVMDRAVKDGVWKKIPGRALNESTIGVIGVGAIGSGVLRRARSFGSRLIGTDVREIQRRHISALAVEMVSLDVLLSESDFVSLNCDLNPTSHHLISTAQLKLMKSTAYLINCARGPCVDEKTLAAALKDGEIAGAALDVFEDEPLPSDSLLRQMDNVLLAPHNSNSSPKAWEHVHLNTLDQLLEGLRSSKR